MRLSKSFFNFKMQLYKINYMSLHFIYFQYLFYLIYVLLNVYFRYCILLRILCL